MRQRTIEFQRREERIIAAEEELKAKIFEAGRQLTIKEEEIMGIKKRFKEERNLLELDKKKLISQLEESKMRQETAETKYYSFKKEIDESPLSMLRQELGLKNLEIIELENKVKAANEAKEDYRKKFE